MACRMQGGAPLNVYFVLAGLVGLLLATGGGYLQGRSDGRDVASATAAREERLTRMAASAATDASVAAIAAIRGKNTTIKQEVVREIVDRPVYRECVHPDGVVRNINAAITGQPATSAVGTVMPRADATDGTVIWRDNPKTD